MAHGYSVYSTSDEYESSQLGSDDASTISCQPCELENKHEPAFGFCQNCAEHLCETCYRFHRRPAPWRDHVLLDKNQMQKIRGSGQQLQISCEKHNGESIKYLCKDHNIIGCGPCITIEHRTCQVAYINEVAEDF